MIDILTTSNIIFGIGIIGTLFTVYNYFREPQVKSETTESILKLKIESLNADVINLRDNHMHTLEVKIDSINTNLNDVSKTVVKLATILDERVPRREQV